MGVTDHFGEIPKYRIPAVCFENGGIEVQTTYSQTLSIKSYETDISGRCRLSSLFLNMQELATQHASLLGCGREELVENGIVWILSRVHLEMFEYPETRDDIIATTWPGAVRAPFFPRYYRFTRPNGKLIGHAATSWLLFDIRSRKLARPSILKTPVPVDETITSPLPLPGKLVCPDHYDLSEYRDVRYSDIDVNAHMNNASYVDWICDVFGIEHFRNHAVQSMKLSFNSEILPESQVALYRALSGDAHYIRGVERESGKNLFDALITFKKDPL